MPAKKNDFDENEKKSSKISAIIFLIMIIVVWLGLFAFLIKLDVGGFGSGVMYPIFKNVPIIKEILPEVEEEEVTSSPYKSLADAIKRIKELELEVQKLNQEADTYKETIADLQSEVSRLEAFEDDQVSFNEIKQQFYDEVVFGDDALPYENYKVFYESINPEYAEKLYKQVLQKYFYDERYKELANVYTAMKPKKAAASLYEMTGDLDKVVAILNNMETEPRAEVLEALSDIDAVFCGKLTVMLAPSK